MTNSGIGTEPQLIRVCLDFDDVESVFFGGGAGCRLCYRISRHRFHFRLLSTHQWSWRKLADIFLGWLSHASNSTNDQDG